VEDTLEVRLMEKNKKLESEYTQIKLSFADLQKDCVEKTKSIESLGQKLNEKSMLVQRLEEDLLRIGQQKSSDLLDALSAKSSTVTPNPLTPDGSTTPHLDTRGSKDDKSILPIVMSQRDRFRQRNAELEERVRSLETSLQDSRSEIQSLKADNLKLYERLKFVHVWKEGQQQDKGLVVRTLVKCVSTS
jgi:homeobox protein cut-like